VLGQDICTAIRSQLAAAHGDRFHGAVLFGSQARGDATPESDVDILVLLKEPIDLVRDLQMNVRALRALSAQIGRRISAKPVGAEAYEAFDCPLFRATHREGILL